MPINIDIYSITIFSGIMQGLFLFYIFAQYSRVNRKNIYFALFILSASLISVEILFNYIGLTANYLYLVDFSEPLNFSIAPLFYIYLRQNYFNLKTKNWLHLSYAIFYFFYSFLFWLQTDQFKYSSYLSAYDPLNSIKPHPQLFHHDPLSLKANVMEIMVVQLIIYFVLIIRLFRSRELKTKKFYKPTVYKRILPIFLFMIIAIIFVRNYFEADLGDHFLAVCITIHIYYLSFLVYTKSTVLNANFTGLKYKKSTLTNSEKEARQKQIINKLESEKVYLDSRLNLARFSRLLSIPSNQMSQIINECFHMNFNELLNSYRIKEAHKRIVDPDYQYIKIEVIGYECGFNSKSAFFTAFKRYTQMTPAAYRKMMQEQESQSDKL